MSSAIQARDKGVASFRTRLFTAMMVIVATMTAFGLYLAQRKVTADAERNLRQIFQAELSSLHKLEDLRHVTLAERCNALALKQRIHAALEDNALDLLYPSAKDELRDLMEGDEESPHQAISSLHAKFYRFLDGTGAVLRPRNPRDVVELDPKMEAELGLQKLPETQQIGYIRGNSDAADEIIDQVVAVPIFSTETGDVISALVVGFRPIELTGKGAGAGMKSGIWVNGQLYLPSLSKSAQAAVGGEIAKALSNSVSAQNNFTVTVNAAPHLLFYK